jgi:hypothetical protein
MTSRISRALRAVRPSLLAWVVLAPGLLSAAPLPPVEIDLDEPKPHIVIRRLDRTPLLEDFLEMRPPADLAGQLVRVEGLIQGRPEDGRPASQRTQIYLGYDATRLYVVFVAFDDEPEKLRANLSRRERITDDDTVEIMIDSFHDRRRAFAFLCNPLGVQWDALWTEGRGFDSSWNTVWHSRGQLTDRGYVVWMAIPFKSLRFKPDEEQTWGLIFVRDVPRNNETSFWPRVSSRIEGRLNQEATVGGLEGISPGRNMQVIPYATARRSRALDVAADRFETEELDLEAGADAKLVLEDRVALDLTVNPDFSQIESDQPQVTVNQRFEVFFPELRPFFLERADFFQTPFNLLFTRRIDEPRLGARLTGKLGAYAVAALLIDDETPGKEADPESPGRDAITYNGVVRVNRDISRRSTLGFIYTQRNFEERSNRVGGVDGRIVLDANWDTEFQLAYSSTRDRVDAAGGAKQTLTDPAWQWRVDRRGRKLNWHLHLTDIGRDFNTDLGFVNRTDLRNAHQNLVYNFRPEGPQLVRWGPSLFLDYAEDQAGTRLDVTARPQIEWEFRGLTSFGFFANLRRERLRPEDLSEPELAPAAGLDFPRSNVGLFFSNRAIRTVQGSFNLSAGKGVNFSPVEGQPPSEADELALRIDLTLRPLPQLRIDNRYLLSRLDDDRSGDRVFVNQLFRSTLNYQFDIRWSLRVILDYRTIRSDARLTTVDSGRNFNADLLLTYLINPWTAIYAGYNSNHATDEELLGTTVGADGDWVNDSQEIFLKASYLFRF